MNQDQEYTNEDKIGLKNDIELITNKETLVKILKLIDDSSKRKITANNNNTFAFIDSLPNDTYVKINKLVDEEKCRIKEKQEIDISIVNILLQKK